MYLEIYLYPVTEESKEQFLQINREAERIRNMGLSKVKHMSVHPFSLNTVVPEWYQLLNFLKKKY